MNSLKTFRELFRYNEQKGKEVEKITSKERLLTVMNQYQNLVFSICLKLTGDYFAAEDLTQDTFLSVYRHFGDFDGKNEKAWICRIATNKCYDYNQAAERRAIATAQDEMPEVSTPYIQEPLQQVLNHEILDKVRLSTTCHRPTKRWQESSTWKAIRPRKLRCTWGKI